MKFIIVHYLVCTQSDFLGCKLSHNDICANIVIYTKAMKYLEDIINVYN
jgi:hypothetical protein